jgi:hypothetical protein
MPIKQNYDVGDLAYFSTEVEPRTVENIVGSFVKLSGMSACSSDRVEKADSTRYYKKSKIVTIKDHLQFFNEIPKRLTSKSLLQVKTGGTKALSDYKNFSNTLGGLRDIQKWSDKEYGNDDVTDELEDLSDDGFRSRIVFELFASKNKSILSVTLELLDDHVHLIAKLNKVESIIRKETIKYSVTTKELQTGTAIKRILLEHPDEVLSYSSKEIETLTMIDSILKRCLINWPKKTYGNKISLDPEVWRSKPIKYENILDEVVK